MSKEINSADMAWLKKMYQQAQTVVPQDEWADPTEIDSFVSVKTVEVPDMDDQIFEKHFGVDLTEFRTKEGG